MVARRKKFLELLLEAVNFISCHLIRRTLGCMLIDTTAYLSSPTILEFSFNKDLQTLSLWFESNHLTVNSAKTQAISVGPCTYTIIILYFVIKLE